MAGVPTFVATPGGRPINFVNADGTAKKLLFTAGVNGAKLMAVNVTSPEAKTVRIYYRQGATDSMLMALTVTAGSGTNGTLPPMSLLDIVITMAKDNDGQRYFFIEGGDSVYCDVTVAVTGVNVVSVKPDYGNI